MGEDFLGSMDGRGHESLGWECDGRKVLGFMGERGHGSLEWDRRWVLQMGEDFLGFLGGGRHGFLGMGMGDGSLASRVGEDIGPWDGDGRWLLGFTGGRGHRSLGWGWEMGPWLHGCERT